MSVNPDSIKSIKKQMEKGNSRAIKTVPLWMYFFAFIIVVFDYYSIFITEIISSKFFVW